jgi:hypothetical protein
MHVETDQAPSLCHVGTSCAGVAWLRGRNAAAQTPAGASRQVPMPLYPIQRDGAA